MYRIFRKILGSFQGDFEFEKWTQFRRILINFMAYFLESP